MLLDRAGAIAGRYRKTHLPLVEAEAGVTPGSAYPVFKTDFGMVGLLICWDLWFPEVARKLSDGGARLLCVSTIGNAAVQAAARAVDNGVAVVVAGQDGPSPSRIIDAAGEVLGEIAGDRDDACVREVDLGRRIVRRWFSVGDADGEVGNVLRSERRLDTY